MGCYCSILVAYDGSPDAAAALEHAGALARDEHARLILLTVVPNVPVPTIDAAVAAAARDLERDYARRLREATATVPADVSVECRLARGKPTTQIIQTARELRCDLIVMGSHGHGRLREALNGSTSATVVRESDTPVLLVRSDHTAPRDLRKRTTGLEPATSSLGSSRSTN
jgi:nucleotide-binding universal stress UspA family protein